MTGVVVAFGITMGRFFSGGISTLPERSGFVLGAELAEFASPPLFVCCPKLVDARKIIVKITPNFFITAPKNQK
jgi:hypothetical protein